MKTVVITGCTKGIGKALAYRFARENFNIIGIARDEEKLKLLKEKLEAEFNIKFTYFVGDLSKYEQVSKTIDFLSVNDFDVLINNAGFGLHGEFLDLDIDAQIAMINLNVTALVRLTHFAINKFKKMGKHDASVINIGSTAGFMPGPYNAIYFATKAFVNSFSQAVHEELEGTDINVLCICPGLTKTNFFENAKWDINGQMMSAEEVADITYQSYVEKKVIVVTGFYNAFMISIIKRLPESWKRYLTKKLLK